ncbi:hypothetical protein RJ639_021292 [Escallonia herrerae]|uniref:Uncharacterized protein n=1 Tax=Escallonia herrerae TaxID=1293975 RepID=A0AA88V4H4_9ASTE|nr:hypothetical protein RJ639_021292 [Escallonia herrerae]
MREIISTLHKSDLQRSLTRISQLFSYSEKDSSILAFPKKDSSLGRPEKDSPLLAYSKKDSSLLTYSKKDSSLFPTQRRTLLSWPTSKKDSSLLAYPKKDSSLLAYSKKDSHLFPLNIIQDTLLILGESSDLLSPSNVGQDVSYTKGQVATFASKSKLEIPLEPAFPLLSKPLPNPPTLLRVPPNSLQYEQGKVGAVPDHVAAEGDVSAMEYLRRLLVSKVYDVAVESPLQLATKLSDGLGVKVWLKREDIQPGA